MRKRVVNIFVFECQITEQRIMILGVQNLFGPSIYIALSQPHKKNK